MRMSIVALAAAGGLCVGALGQALRTRAPGHAADAAGARPAGRAAPLARPRGARRRARRNERAGRRLWLQLTGCAAWAACWRRLLAVLPAAPAAQAADAARRPGRGPAARLRRRRRHARQRPGAAGAQEPQGQGVAVAARCTWTWSATRRSTWSPPPARSRRRRTAGRPGAGLCLPRRAAHAGPGQQQRARLPRTQRCRLDVAQDFFGAHEHAEPGLHARGRRRGQDRRQPAVIDQATHWQYRLGLTQVLSARAGWPAPTSRLLADNGLLGSPYRVARRVRRRGARDAAAHPIRPRPAAVHAWRRKRTPGRRRATPTTATTGTPGAARAHAAGRHGRELGQGWTVETSLRLHRQTARRCSTATTPPARHATSRRNRAARRLHRLGPGRHAQARTGARRWRQPLVAERRLRVQAPCLQNFTDLRTGQPMRKTPMCCSSTCRLTTDF
jgi:hypothetical protein